MDVTEELCLSFKKRSKIPQKMKKNDLAMRLQTVLFKDNDVKSQTTIVQDY